MTTTVLYDNKWISLNMIKDPDVGITGYVYSHEKRCGGKIVALLPFRTANGKLEYLVKREITPCWGLQYSYSSVTGGWEGGDTKEDAVREMLEETGYTISPDDLTDLGTSYASKSSDTVYQLYTCDLTGKNPGPILGDGEELEQFAVWVDHDFLISMKDPQIHVMFCRMMR